MLKSAIRPILVAGAVVALLPARPATQAADPKFEQLAALVTEKMAEYNIPGVAFGLVKNGHRIVRGFGVTNVENEQPITTETVFPIASISKTVTATAIMRLVEQKKLDLNAPVRQYLPEFAVQDERVTREVAIWQLLTHTAGWEGQRTPADRGPQSLAAFIDTIKAAPQLAPPGEIWSYNNAGFTIAGRVIEVVSERPIHDAIRTLVFEPIGLARAFTRTEEAVTHRFAVAHRTSSSGQLTVVRPISRSNTATTGGVWMSLADMLTYAAFHLGDGTGTDGKPVLSRASLELMRTPRVK